MPPLTLGDVITSFFDSAAPYPSNATTIWDTCSDFAAEILATNASGACHRTEGGGFVCQEGLAPSNTSTVSVAFISQVPIDEGVIVNFGDGNAVDVSGADGGAVTCTLLQGDAASAAVADEGVGINDVPELVSGVVDVIFIHANASANASDVARGVSVVLDLPPLLVGGAECILPTLAAAVTGRSTSDNCIAGCCTRKGGGASDASKGACACDDEVRTVGAACDRELRCLTQREQGGTLDADGCITTARAGGSSVRCDCTVSRRIGVFASKVHS